MVDIAFLPAAEADYQGALVSYGAANPRTGARFEAAVAAGLEHIARDPEFYALIDDRHRRCILRRFPYSLIYRIEPEGVIVVAVAHSSRSSANWRGRG